MKNKGRLVLILMFLVILFTACGKENEQTAEGDDEVIRVISGLDITKVTDKEISEDTTSKGNTNKTESEKEVVDSEVTLENEKTENSQNEANEETTIPAETTPSEPETETSQPEHTHSYTSSIITEATCTSSGQVKYVCECGDIYYETTQPTGHRYTNKEVVKEADCANSGSYKCSCTICGVVVFEVIPVNSEAHKWRHYGDVFGQEKDQCSLCGKFTPCDENRSHCGMP